MKETDEISEETKESIRRLQDGINAFKNRVQEIWENATPLERLIILDAFSTEPE